MILLAGIVIGRFLPGRRRKPRMPTPPKPVCGCTHGLQTHDPETRRCHAQVKTYRHNGISEVLDGYADCACRQYTGPEPLPEFFAQEIGG